MRVQSKTTTALAEEIDVTRGHLSGVLSRKNPLSDAKIQHGTFCFFDPPGGGVSWEVLKQRRRDTSLDLSTCRWSRFGVVNCLCDRCDRCVDF